MPYTTNEISWQGRTFILNHKIICTAKKEDGLIIIEYEPLKIRSYAINRKKAVQDFNEEFSFLWEQYGKADDQLLAKDAIAIKLYLKNLIKMEFIN